MKRSAASSGAAAPLLLIAGLLCAAPAEAQRGGGAPARQAVSTRPAGTKPSAPAGAPAGQTTPRPSTATPAGAPGSGSGAGSGPTNACDYLDPAEAAPLVGAEATLASAPSRGAFATCGYTSATGDAVTIAIAEYGLIDVAQQFFDRSRDALKTAVKDDTYGVPAYTYRPADQPTRVTYAALKGSRTVVLEAAGPLAASAAAAPHLKAILTKALAKIPTTEPARPPEEEAPQTPATGGSKPTAKPKPTPRPKP